MNPNKDSDRAKLRTAIEHARLKLQPFREFQLWGIREYVGPHYGEGNSEGKQPLPLLGLATDIQCMELAANAPRALVTTTNRQYKPQAAKLRLFLDRLIGEINLAETLYAAVKNAMFGWGIVKIGIEEGEREIRGFLHDSGQPYCDVVLLDDWVHDVMARRYEEVSFAGNMYSLPLELVKECKLFKKDVREAMQAVTAPGMNEPGDERVEGLSGDVQVGSSDFMVRTRLIDIWLPYDELLVTMPFGEGIKEGKPLRVVDWEGPEEGMYRHLSFNHVPANIMPLPPVATLMDLHTLANRLFIKLGRQAERQKTNPTAPTASGNLAETHKDAKDGDLLVVDGQIGEMKSGGIDAPNFAFLLQVMQKFNYFGGNIEALGGLGPQSDTLGQDELLSASASKRTASMQRRTETFAQGIMRDLAWYGWTDPLIDMPLVKRVAGTNIEVPVRFSAEDLEGDILDYEIDIQPYSMQYESPAGRVRSLLELVTQFLLPAAPLLAQQGVHVRFDKLMRIIADYRNLPELNDILETGYEPAEQGSADQARQSPVTRRENVRINRPGATNAGQDDVMMRAMMGQVSQGAETAATGRPTG